VNKQTAEPNYFWRRKIIGVMGGGSDTSHPTLTKPLGRLIAKMGYHLLTGAGQGVMEEVCKSFFKYDGRQGLVLGIIRPHKTWDIALRPAYTPNEVNEWIEVPIYTHLPVSNKSKDSRNHINALTSDVIIALPGGAGTQSEVELALEYDIPVIFFLGTADINGNLPAFFSGKYPTSRTNIAATINGVETAINGFIPT